MKKNVLQLTACAMAAALTMSLSACGGGGDDGEPAVTDTQIAITTQPVAVTYDAAGAPIGTGRLLPDGHIGRMAVRKVARGTGIGGALLLGLMAQARLRGHQTVVLGAQTHAAPFYEKHGFAIVGDQFFEAGIPHVEMAHTFG
eukprot:gene36032-44440_t